MMYLNFILPLMGLKSSATFFFLFQLISTTKILVFKKVLVLLLITVCFMEHPGLIIDNGLFYGTPCLIFDNGMFSGTPWVALLITVFLWDTLVLLLITVCFMGHPGLIIDNGMFYLTPWSYY